MRARPPRPAARVLALSALALSAGTALAQDAPPPRPPERPPGITRMEMAPPVPVARPGVSDEDAEPDAQSPGSDARTDDAPAPPRRPVVPEPDAVIPDEERAPLAVTEAEREENEACLADLERLGVVFETSEPIDGEGDCGAAFPLSVSAIGDVALEPAVVVRCPVARALARWTVEALVPAADEHLDAAVTTIFTAGAYVCRGRNRQEGARLSEHAYANAVDVTGVDFAARAALPVEPRAGRGTDEARFQREIRTRACAFFRTVLGPGSDDFHDDHLHFDQRERTNDYRLCQ